MSGWGLSVEVLQVAILALIAVVSYFLRGVLAEIKAIKEGQHAFQLLTVERYQLKAEADADSEQQWARLGEHDKAISACTQQHASHARRLDALEGRR